MCRRDKARATTGTSEPARGATRGRAGVHATGPAGARRPARATETIVTCASQFRWTSAARTDVGLVRERNEDACLSRPERGLWVVADGMGGHAVGDYASNLVVETLDRLGEPRSLEGLLDDARAALLEVNRALLAEATRRQVRRIGCTVVVLMACERFCGCLWAGDSRIYLYRDAHLTQLTRDHSRVEELKARGLITAEEALHHPAHNTITRAVGANASLELEQTWMEAADGDMFLLCSDGISNELRDPEIAGFLACGDCELAAQALVTAALERGGHDNISAVVARAEDLYANDKTMVNPAL